MEYLQNYLAVLPEYDRSEVERLVQENMELFDVKVITKEEFEALIHKLSKRQEKVTVLTPTGEKVDAEHFNEMHANTALDLSRLYDSHLIVEKVMANYDRILRGTLDDIQREVDTLSMRVEELNLKAKGEDGLVVKTYGFEEKEKSLYMETDREKYRNLFVDRDGKEIETASINRSFHQHYLSLPIRMVENALQSKNGMKTASIQIVEKPAGAKGSINHRITHAIDSSKESYWAQSVTTSSPAFTKMNKR